MRCGAPPPISYDAVEFEVVLSSRQKLKIEVNLREFQELRSNKDDKFSVIPLSKVA